MSELVIFVLLTSHQGFPPHLINKPQMQISPSRITGQDPEFNNGTCSFTPDINRIMCIISVLFHLSDTAAIIKQSSNYNVIRDSRTQREWEAGKCWAILWFESDNGSEPGQDQCQSETGSDRAWCPHGLISFFHFAMPTVQMREGSKK